MEVIKSNFKLFCICLLCTIAGCKQDVKNNTELPKATQQQEEMAGATFAVTLNGKRLHEIPEPDSIKMKYKADLDAARIYYLGHLNEARGYLMYGAECIKSGLVENAIQVLSKGIDQFPDVADLFLYRGIAKVTGRQFSDAINDFWKAGKAVEGKKNVKGLLDKTEEQKKIDASLHYEIYMWMGLAFQGQSDFSNAEKMYEVCGDFSTNSDLYCMAYYWQYQAYKRVGKEEDAARILQTVEPGMFITPVTKPYLDALLYYKGSLKENELVDLNSTPQSSVEARDWTIKAYAIAVKSYLEKKNDKYLQTLDKIIAIPFWNQMAFIAAEADFHKMKGYDYKQMETKELKSENKKK
jgi:tetratricopeptide (TPR) repeat protein